jgi:uncharacterized protein YfkK (UPF0435 family)
VRHRQERRVAVTDQSVDAIKRRIAEITDLLEVVAEERSNAFFAGENERVKRLTDIFDDMVKSRGQLRRDMKEKGVNPWP